MQVTVSRPNFKQDFQMKLTKAASKGAVVTILPVDSGFYVVAKTNGRILGKFVFTREEDNVRLTKRHIIEREYFPLELSIASLVKYLKRRKVKYILWD